VDAQGHAVVDPTQNVLDLVHAAIQRQDDLRVAESVHIRELMDRDRLHARDLRERERDRIDAIRAVDVGAVQRAAEVQLAQATALATQTATMAETLRASQAAGAALTATNLATALEPMQRSIDALRQSQFEAQGGKLQTVEHRAASGGSRDNVSLMVGALAILISLATLIVLMTR
jgi:hypothetical protein